MKLIPTKTNFRKKEEEKNLKLPRPLVGVFCALRGNVWMARNIINQINKQTYGCVLAVASDINIRLQIADLFTQYAHYIFTPRDTAFSPSHLLMKQHKLMQLLLDEGCDYFFKMDDDNIYPRGYLEKMMREAL